MNFMSSKLLFRNGTTRLCLWKPFKNTISTNVAETDDGTCFVCWHPEKKFPYEFTRPLPQPSKECTESNVSPLKVQNPADVYKVFKGKSPEVVRQELMKMTCTTKHRWFPRSRDKYAKKTPRDREYL